MLVNNSKFRKTSFRSNRTLLQATRWCILEQKPLANKSKVQTGLISPKFILAPSFNIFNKYYEHLLVLSNRNSVVDKTDPVECSWDGHFSQVFGTRSPFRMVSWFSTNRLSSFWHWSRLMINSELLCVLMHLRIVSWGRKFLLKRHQPFW